jgi:type I restriction enzyme S subunit
MWFRFPIWLVASELTATEGLPYIGLDQMPRGSTVLTRWLTKDAPKASTGFERATFCLASYGPTSARSVWLRSDGRCSTEILVLRAVRPELYGFVLGHVFSQRFIDHCNAVSTGTKMPRSEWKNAGTYAVTLPSKDVLQDLTGVAELHYTQIGALTRESHRLACLRDELLPRLVSGDLVPDASEVTEDYDAAPIMDAEQ